MEIAGRDIGRDPIGAKRLLAYVPDDPHLFENLTVLEHLRFTGSVYGVRDWRTRADRLLDVFELDSSATPWARSSRGGCARSWRPPARSSTSRARSSSTSP